MKNINNNRLRRDLGEWLPDEIVTEISQIKRTVNEVRLRAGAVSSVTSGITNVRLKTYCTQQDLSEILVKLCNGSLHAYEDSIINGFINLKDGYRAGICGRAIINDGEIINITDVSSINIRVPCFISGVSGELFEYIISKESAAVLIYSPPGGGKTTLLRDLAIRLSGPPNYTRLALIDSRMELYEAERMQKTLIDLYSGYPKAKAIELATRTMAPEYIMCDEIGDKEEALALLTAQNAGVPLIASAHARDLEGLLRRDNIKMLHNNKIFDCYVKIKRNQSGGFDFTLNDWEEAEWLLK